MSRVTDGLTAPVGGGDFAALMAALGPYEARPHVVAACSGGADSMALTLLLQEWTRARGGSLTALTVDHRLGPNRRPRPGRSRLGSGGAASRMRRWFARIRRSRETCRRRRAEHAIALLSSWCRERGVLHLVLAHHLEDQAETLLLRLARGSGVDGLAAMAPVSETPTVRLLRPLLTVPKARLGATLEAVGQPHVEDPSNESAAFRRVRLRHASSVLAREGLTAERLAATAARMARARAALDDAAARLLARAAALYPEGYAFLDLAEFRAAPRGGSSPLPRTCSDGRVGHRLSAPVRTDGAAP